MVIILLEESEDDAARCFSSDLYRYQVSMIGRIDDCTKISPDNLMCNFHHDEYSILARLCWSKNIHTEADVQDQVLLGASYPHYCVLFWLATWIEYLVRAYGAKNKFVFN